MYLMGAKDSYNDVLRLMKEHHGWFNKSIPLIASENIPSTAVREAMMSDFGNRYAEGWPGERVYAGCTYIDQVELICNDLAKNVFRAEFADCRATSGVVANLAIYAPFFKSRRLYDRSLNSKRWAHFTWKKRTFWYCRSCPWTKYRTLPLFKGRDGNRC